MELKTNDLLNLSSIDNKRLLAGFNLEKQKEEMLNANHKVEIGMHGGFSYRQLRKIRIVDGIS
jgi:hypothetical protein